MGRSSEYKLSDLFGFEERDITSHMMRELKLGRKFKDSFNYILTKLPIQKLKADLSKLKWDEGKNYDWAIIKDGLVTLIFRKYSDHFTIFFKVEAGPEDDYTLTYNKGYGCFSFHTNKDKLSDEDSDSRVDDNFLDLNKYIKAIIKLLADGDVHSLWNSYSLKNPDEVSRPEYIELKNIWNGGNEDISSINDFIFCCDELFNKYLELFAQTDMMNKIKKIKAGDMLGVYKVVRVNPKTKDSYYHDAGLELKNTNFKDSKPSWADVYSLTRYYLNYVFPELDLVESK